MTDGFAPARGPGEDRRPLSRLTDRIAAMAPPPTVLELSNPTPPPPRPSLAVAAALDRTAVMAEAAAQTAKRRPRSLLVLAIGGFVAACSFIPYALVALVLRFVMARLFFLDGQTRIDGPHWTYDLHGFVLSLVLPLQVKADTFVAFLTHYIALPLPPALAAYLLSGGEFLLPIMLMLGLGTRIAAFGLLIVTAVIQFYVLPGALWITHVYWASILLVLLALGPGPVSFDHLIRWLTRR